MPLFGKRKNKLSRQLAHGLLEDAMARAEERREPDVPQPETPRLLCYSPNGGFAHDDTCEAIPRPACHGGAKRYVRAVTPEQKKRAAALRPCPHCARLRESSEGRVAS